MSDRTEDEEDAAEQAALHEAMIEVLRISRRHKVCTACLLFNCAAHMSDALDAGRIGHGIPGIDWELRPEVLQ